MLTRKLRKQLRERGLELLFLGGSLEGFCRTLNSINKPIISLDRN
jgi:hypothetical protein